MLTVYGINISKYLGGFVGNSEVFSHQKLHTCSSLLEHFELKVML